MSIDDLLVLEQFEEAIVGHVLEVGVSAAAEENGEADQRKGDGDENDAAPVKARLVSARFVLLLGVAIRLGHRGVERALGEREKANMKGLAMQRAGAEPDVRGQMSMQHDVQSV